MHNKIIPSLLIIISFFNYNCSKEEETIKVTEVNYSFNYEYNNDSVLYPYSIQIKSFKDADSAAIFISSFESDNNLTPYIEKVELAELGKWHRIKLGSYKSAINAGIAAFHLFDQGIVDDYILTKGNEFITDPYRYFVFAAPAAKNTGLFKYDILKDAYSPFWSLRNETVLDFSYADDNSTAFFVTASSAGKIGLFPFVRNVKIYQFDPVTSKVTMLKEIGSGLQVFTSWEKENSFKVIFNNIDQTVASYVEQFTYIFNQSGRLALEEKKVFDLTTEGFPPYPSITKQTLSPSGNAQLNAAKTDLAYDYSIINNKKETYVTTLPESLNRVYWTEDGKYIVFTTFDLTPANETLYDDEPQTSNIFVFSLEENKVVFHKDGGGIKNFLMRGNNLFFDDGFGDSSSVLCYNIKKNELTTVISLKGGCGLRNIPQIPDYDA